MVHSSAHAGPGVFLALAFPALLLCAYLYAIRKELRGGPWKSWRTASFTVGILLIMIALSPPVSHWSHHDLRGHMFQHLLLGMFAPLALVLGAPGTLLLRHLPLTASRAIVAFLARLPVRVLIHPLTAALLDIGGLYVLYLSPLYAFSLSSPITHVLLHIHFVVSGYLFTWSIVGPDPAPHRPGMYTRLAVLYLATAAHANLGKIMYGYGYPRGIHADISEIQGAAQWMYYGGDFAETLLIIAFFAMWFGRRRAAGTHHIKSSGIL